MSFFKNLFEGKSDQRAPFYSDMGKDLKDLFTDDLDHQKVKVKVTSSTSDNFDFKATGCHSKADNKSCGDVEFKYKRPDYGFSYTESWDTANNLNAKLELEKELKEIPTKLILNSGFVPLQNSNLYVEGILKNSHQFATLENGTKIKKDLSTIESCHQLVFGKGGLYLGGIFGYNWVDKNSTQHDITLGYSGKTFQMHANLYEKWNKVCCSMLHEVNPELTFGMKSEYSRNDALTTISGVLKYKMNDTSIFKTTLNNHGLLGLSYRQELRPFVALVLNAEINTMAFSGGNHKSGLGIEITP